MKNVLTIAGTDPSGGAGAQADLKTFMAHEVYGMSVITALVAQNTTGGYGDYGCATTVSARTAGLCIYRYTAGCCENRYGISA